MASIVQVATLTASRLLKATCRAAPSRCAAAPAKHRVHRASREIDNLTDEDGSSGARRFVPSFDRSARAFLFAERRPAKSGLAAFNRLRWSSVLIDGMGTSLGG